LDVFQWLADFLMDIGESPLPRRRGGALPDLLPFKVVSKPKIFKMTLW
jgi:hypothetical protein